MPEGLPLSHAQEALWFLHQLAPDSSAHNTGVAVVIRSAIDLPALHRATDELARRHDLLRSTFAEADGRPVRLVGPDGLAGLEVLDRPGVSDAALRAAVEAALAEPFPLRERGAFRTVLVRRGPQDAVLLIASHHIASDATSHLVLLRDLLRSYEPAAAGGDPTLPPLPGTFDDHVGAERGFLASPRGAETELHWRRVCAGAAPAELPADRPRSAGTPFVGDVCRVEVDPEAAARLRAVAAESGVTEFAYLLGVFQGLLYRSTRQADFLIGCPTTTRLSSKTREVVGNFTNTLVLRANLARGSTFRAAAVSAAEQLRAGVAGIRYPFPLLASRVRLSGGAPLCRLTFNMLNATGSDPLLGLLLDTEHEDRVVPNAGLLLSSLPLPQLGGELDLMVNVRRSADALAVEFRYNANVFERETMRRLAGHFARAIAVAVAGPDSRIATARLWDTAEPARS
ncbi:hypothetical protein F0L68_25075 [Solihabitans fulvus]|uniref:Condensation domain-containing protein n=1 Tax=Solihabitans fulvus TaxID=1892852 RepID=A0A5B2X325_9PSEU|nr:condensation domain-containing protein [Solihabitans fulvus]KAA2257571.1 hypothetical protein F0L68_25075 [Solihabitans fulvus]